MVDLEKLEELAKAATPRPWDYDTAGVFKWHFLLEKRHVCECLTEENAAYIVAACNAVPELIKMYRMADDEAADANSAWQKVRRENLALREQVRELERQNSFFLKALKEEYACPYSRCKYDYGSELDEWECSNENHQDCWIQAAKEAGECP